MPRLQTNSTPSENHPHTRPACPATTRPPPGRHARNQHRPATCQFLPVPAASGDRFHTLLRPFAPSAAALPDTLPHTAAPYHTHKVQLFIALNAPITPSLPPQNPTKTAPTGRCRPTKTHSKHHSNPLPTHFQPTSNPLPTRFQPTSNPLPTHFQPASNPLPTRFQPASNPSEPHFNHVQTAFETWSGHL
jgi:hypothetical protein